MAITNGEAVAFSNLNVRPMADSFVTAYDTAKRFSELWASQAHLSALFPNDANEIVQDGSPADGRHPISGQLVQGLPAICTTLVAYFDVVVGSKKRIDWLREADVNGGPKF